MAEFFDISDWQEKIHYQTGGTRNKSVVENLSTTDLYFFKKSIPKYQHEFWSEIIASEVGNALGFNVLKYDIANKNGEVGCISKLMINPEFQQLTEGINYLQGYDSTYLPEKKESYEKYTFHFIEEALKEYNLEKTIPDLIRTIIFDSIIGNGDRHQENWGIITDYNEVIKSIEVITKKEKKNFLERQIYWLLKRLSGNNISEAVKELQLILSFPVSSHQYMIVEVALDAKWGMIKLCY